MPRLYQGRDMGLSYVMWDENVSPLIVVELLSPGTEDEDLGRTTSEPGRPPTKWQVYEQILRVPYTEELQVFRLVRNRYRMAALTQGGLLIPEIQLSLGLWRGDYMGCDQLWLRWMTDKGDLIAPATDAATKAAIEQEKQEKEAAQQEIEQLKALLLKHGIDPEQQV